MTKLKRFSGDSIIFDKVRSKKLENEIKSGGNDKKLSELNRNKSELARKINELNKLHSEYMSNRYPDNDFRHKKYYDRVSSLSISINTLSNKLKFINDIKVD